MKNVFTFDLGPSLVLRNRTVNDIVKEHFPRSLELGALAMLFALLVGIPLGAFAALRPNSSTDYGAMFFANVGFAIPSFLVATLLIYFFALKWGTRLADERLGRLAVQDPARRSRSGSARWRTSPGSCAGSMLETLQQDYVRTAKAKGLRWRRIVGAARAAQLAHPGRDRRGPAARLPDHRLVHHRARSSPSRGSAGTTSPPCTARDYSVVMGLTVLLAVIIIFANLVVDILYGFLDPRTREARPDGRRSREKPRVASADPRGEPRRATRPAPPIRAVEPLARRAAPLHAQPRRAGRRRRLLLLVALLHLRPDLLAVRPERGRLRAGRTSRRAAAHPFGTDQFGRDLLTRAALGGRVSIGIGFAATLAILLIGVTYGSISGFVGGKLDNGMMRFLDALYGLPYLPFAIITLAIFGTVNFWTMVVALSIASWFTTARDRARPGHHAEGERLRARREGRRRALVPRAHAATCCRTRSAS